jgi:hypothetical protein
MDSSSRAGVIAAMLLVAACDSGDAGPATVHIVDDVPVVGRDVVFQTSDGSVVTHAQTGADGVASAEVSPGGMVTVVRADGSAARALTVMGVQPGDHLEMGWRYTRSVLLGEASVTGPGAFAGAAVYVVQVPCAAVYTASLSAPIVMDITSTCLDADGRLQLLGVAHDASLVPVAFSYVRDIDFGAHAAAVTLPAWRTDWQDVAVELRNPPEAASDVSASLRLRRSTSVLQGDSVSRSWTTGALSFPLRLPRGFADAVNYEVEVASVPGRPNERSRQGLSGTWPATAIPPTLPVDATVDLLPRLHTPVLDATDPVRPTVTWSATGDIAGTTALRVEITWAASRTWAIVAPPGVPLPLTVPALPDALAAFRPPAAAPTRVEVFAIDAPSIGGYAGYRQGFADMGVHTAAESVPAARTTSSVVVTR